MKRMILAVLLCFLVFVSSVGPIVQAFTNFVASDNLTDSFTINPLFDIESNYENQFANEKQMEIHEGVADYRIGDFVDMGISDGIFSNEDPDTQTFQGNNPVFDKESQTQDNLSTPTGIIESKAATTCTIEAAEVRYLLPDESSEEKVGATQNSDISSDVEGSVEAISNETHTFACPTGSIDQGDRSEVVELSSTATDPTLYSTWYGMTREVDNDGWWPVLWNFQTSVDGSHYLYVGQDLDWWPFYDYFRAHVQWDTSSIPDNAIIDSVKIRIYIGTYFPPIPDADFDSHYCYMQFYAMNNRPSDYGRGDPIGKVPAGETLWTDAGDGTLYGERYVYQDGNWYEKTLNQWAEDDLEYLLSQNWFAIGIKEYTDKGDGSGFDRGVSFLGTNVQLAVEYHVPEGTIAGWVTDSVTGQGISGASVSASGPVSRSDTTDSNGYYEIPNLPPGSYSVTASHSCYYSQTKSASVPQSGGTVTVNFQLQPKPCTIKGRVTDSVTGSGISSAYVYASGPSSGSDYTDSNGYYTISNLNPGSYTVTASKSGYYSQPKSTSVSCGGTSTVNFQLQPKPSTIKGRVTDSVTGSGISGATVSASGPTSRSTTTDSNGYYTISNLNPGSYTVTASHSCYYSQTKSTTAPRDSTITVNFQLQPKPCTIKGRVTDSVTGSGISGATVSASGPTSRSTTTDWNGYYTLSNLNPGSYSLAVTKIGYESQTKSVSVSCGGTSTVNFQLEHAVINIYGYCYYIDQHGNRKPVKYATVNLYDKTWYGVDRLLTDINGNPCSTWTDENGYYSFDPVRNTDEPGGSGTLDVYIELLCDSGAVKVVPVLPVNIWPYRGYSDVVWDVPDGTTVISYTCNDPDKKGCWGIYHSIIEAYQATEERVGYQIPKINVVWPWPATHFNDIWLLQYIGIESGWEWDADVVCHEYGHWVMHQLYGGSVPSVDYGSDGKHYWDSHENPQTAWVEGWANFYSCAIRNDRYFWTYDLDSQWPTGEDVEGAIACILWDIYDSTADGRDTLSMDIEEIWFTVRYYTTDDHHIYDIHEFWDGFTAYFGRKQQMWGIYYDHGINKDTIAPSNPASWSGSHSIGTWSSDNTVEVTWSSASDDLSGVYGYSRVWDSSSATIPDRTVDQTGTFCISQPLSDGTSWYLHVRTVDNAGNWASDAYHIGPFYIERTPPNTPSPDADPSGWSTDTNPTIYSYSVSDAGAVQSGINRYEYQIDSTMGTWKSVELASSFDLPAQPDGIHTVYVRAVDNAGNPSSAGATYIYVDTTEPFIEIQHPQDGLWTASTTIEINWVGLDEASGMDYYEVKINDGDWIYKGMSTSHTFTFGEGSHRVWVKAVDNVGHEKLDRNAFRILYSELPTEPYPGYYETSEYFIGSIAVEVVLLESNGAVDPSTEDWTATEESAVLNKIQDALDWWRIQNPSAGVSFTLHVNYPVPTSYEPTTRPHTDQYLWIGEAMTYLGYPGSDYWNQARDYINDLRESVGTDWSFTIFVVDGSSFTDTTPQGWNWFAYAYFGGPFLVMTYDNNGWGIDNMDRVAAHEIGHIFYATDEYNGFPEHSGYLNTLDVEASGRLMDTSDFSLSSGTWNQIGWRDSDMDGIPDIIDTFPDTTLDQYFPDPTLDHHLVYAGTATVVPYPNQNIYGQGRSVTINTITLVQFRIDSGPWLDATPVDGAFDEPIEEYTFTTPYLTQGIHIVEVRAINSVGNAETSYASDTVEVVIAHDTITEIVGGANAIIDRSPGPTTPHPTTVTLQTKVKDVVTESYLSDEGVVEFWVDGVLVGEDGDADGNLIYEYVWNPSDTWLTLGSQTWEARFKGTPDYNPSSALSTLTLHGQLYNILLSPSPSEIPAPGIYTIQIAVQITSDSPLENNIRGCIVTARLTFKGTVLYEIPLIDPDNDGIYAATATIEVTSTTPPGSVKLDIISKKPNYHDGELPPIIILTIPTFHLVEISINPAAATVQSGTSFSYTVSIHNTGNVPDTYDLTLSGLDASWYSFASDSVTLDPDQTKATILTVLPPADLTVSDLGDYSFVVEAICQADTSVSDTANAVLTAVAPVLVITGNSPVNILVTAPDGLRVGYDPTTGTAVDEIPGATYSGPGSEPQLVQIPNPLEGIYIIDIYGTGTGTYTITMESIALDGSTTDSATWTGTTEPEQQDTVTVEVESDGTITDITPPLTEIAVAGTTGLNDWYISNVVVTLTATEDLSGVALTQYSFDGTAWITYVGSFTVDIEGTTIIYYNSTDNEGNTEETKTETVKVDKTPPELSKSLSGTEGANGWYTSDVTVTLDASDAVSGPASIQYSFDGSIWYTYSTPFILSDEGIITLHHKATDAAGNEYLPPSQQIKIDKTPPVISGTPTTSPNAHGWYNTDVIVHFTATDTTSGVDYITPDQTLTAEGAEQSITGTATDQAGNTASYTVSGINIDKTPPIITGDPTTPANSYGWYNTDVTVHFDVADALSGIATITPDQTLTSEGAGQSVTGTATDKAGNSASYTVSGINIDNTAPTITAAPTTPANAHGWYNSDVTIHFEATDALSGIETITPDTTLSAEGASQSVTGYATDVAGNTASHTVASINIDKTPPTITGAPTTSANAHGWYKADVIVHFEASDSLSGLDSVTPDQTLTAEGAGHSVIGTAVDKAGNTASCTVDGINIDKTPPVITGAPTTSANAYGWYNTDVTVHFEASDALSGLLTLTPDTTLSAEGADQSVMGTAVDLAENEASCTVSGINIDKTPPTIMGAPTTSPNAYGWYNHDVTVHLTASDALSGLDTVTPDQILSGEGADQSVTGVAVDKAGNSASCTVDGINIDKTTPATSLTIGEPKFGTAPTYVSTSTDFTLDAADAISEVDYTEYKIDAGAWTTYSTPFNVLDFDSHTIYYRSVDIAGNVEDTQSLWIVVNAASISYCGDLTDQYSDEATVEAMLVDMATQLPIADKIITFDIGSQSATAVTDISGVATASIVLDQPAGLYTVSAAFSGDTEYLACSDSQTFAITRENAEPEYTGDTVVPTTARSINLRATIFDSPDGFWGDLAKIQVTFNIYAGQLGSTPFMTIPAVSVTQTDTPGVGVAVATIDILPENGYLIIVSIDSNDYYEGPTSDATPLTVYEPTGDFVTGGGWIWDISGSKGNFGFNVKYTKSGRPKGHSTYVYREDGWNIIVKSNAWIGMAIDENHAFFEAKCVVQMYNPATGELVWAEGNYKFRVDVWDNDPDGGVDIYQIRVLDKNGVLFHEAGFTPMGYLQGGNIVIHDEKKKHP